jgi:hypothetical protein
VGLAAMINTMSTALHFATPSTAVLCWHQAVCCAYTQAIPAEQHVSVSRTVALRYSQIEEVVGSLRHRLRKLSRCLSCLAPHCESIYSDTSG